MAGYDRYSMSNNAVTAYSEGKKPLSKITTADLKSAGWCETKALALILAKTGNWQPSEWHHTSKKYNCTNFYCSESLVEWWNELTESERQSLRSQSTIKKTGGLWHECTVRWLEWGGTRKRPVASEQKAVNCLIEYKGGTMVTITFADGSTMRKKIGSRGFEVDTDSLVLIRDYSNTLISTKIKV